MGYLKFSGGRSSLRKLILTTSFLISSITLIAQVNLNFTYDVHTIASVNPVNNFDTMYDWRCILNIQDTLGIDTIHVKMGTSLGSGNKVNHAFVFDDDAFVPNGWIYRREGNQVTLGLGNHLRRTYYMEIHLKDTSNNVSLVKNWNNL